LLSRIVALEELLAVLLIQFTRRFGDDLVVSQAVAKYSDRYQSSMDKSKLVHTSVQAPSVLPPAIPSVSAAVPAPPNLVAPSGSPPPVSVANQRIGHVEAKEGSVVSSSVAAIDMTNDPPSTPPPRLSSQKHATASGNQSKMQTRRSRRVVSGSDASSEHDGSDDDQFMRNGPVSSPSPVHTENKSTPTPSSISHSMLTPTQHITSHSSLVPTPPTSNALINSSVSSVNISNSVSVSSPSLSESVDVSLSRGEKRKKKKTGKKQTKKKGKTDVVVSTDAGATDEVGNDNQPPAALPSSLHALPTKIILPIPTQKRKSTLIQIIQTMYKKKAGQRFADNDLKRLATSAGSMFFNHMTDLPVGDENKLREELLLSLSRVAGLNQCFKHFSSQALVTSLQANSVNALQLLHPQAPHN